MVHGSSTLVPALNILASNRHTGVVHSTRAALIAAVVTTIVGGLVVAGVVAHYEVRIGSLDAELARAKAHGNAHAEEAAALKLAVDASRQADSRAQKAPSTPAPTPARLARVPRPATERLDQNLLAQLQELQAQLATARASETGGADRVAALDLVATGDLNFAAGNLGAARIAYLQALERDAKLADPHLRLGMIHEFYGHEAAAVSAYEEFVRLRPKSKFSPGTARKMGTLFEETTSSAEIFQMEEEDIEISDPDLEP